MSVSLRPYSLWKNSLIRGFICLNADGPLNDILMLGLMKSQLSNSHVPSTTIECAWATLLWHLCFSHLGAISVFLSSISTVFCFPLCVSTISGKVGMGGTVDAILMAANYRCKFSILATYVSLAPLFLSRDCVQPSQPPIWIVLYHDA